MNKEKKQLSRTRLALDVCVFAFMLNYLYSLVLILVSEPMHGLTSLHSNIAYALVVGFPMFLLCGLVLRRGRKTEQSAVKD